jgi:hypothetical protein
VFGATVPEAAVDKNREASATENEIWASEQWLAPAPAGDSGGAEDGSEP